MEENGKYVISEVSDPEERRHQIEEMFRDLSRETLAKKAKGKARRSTGIETELTIVITGDEKGYTIKENS